jgi:putative membrane protein
MMLFMLLLWGMVIAGLVVGIRWLVAQGRASGTDSAMQILRERYARGDISREEFEAKRRDLGP